MREDAAAGTVVARLDVEDADASGAPLSFLVADGDMRARFQLRASGELYVARALDRETEAAYSLSVAATDGKFTAYTTVNITVLDVNGATPSDRREVFANRCSITDASSSFADNPPYCLRHRYRARLSEDAPLGTRVATLLTADADQPATPPHHYLSGDHHHHFAIHKVRPYPRALFSFEAGHLTNEKLNEYRYDFIFVVMSFG